MGLSTWIAEVVFWEIEHAWNKIAVASVWSCWHPQGTYVCIAMSFSISVDRLLDIRYGDVFILLHMINLNITNVQGNTFSQITSFFSVSSSVQDYNISPTVAAKKIVINRKLFKEELCVLYSDLFILLGIA